MAGGSEGPSPEAREKRDADGGEAGPGPGVSAYEEGHDGVEARISSCHVAMPGIPMASPGAPVLGMPVSTVSVPDALYTQRGLQASTSGRDPGGTIGAAAPPGADDEPEDPILVFGSLHRDLPLGATAGMSVPSSFVQPLKLRQQLRMICLIHIAAIVITISTAGAADESQVSLPLGMLSILFPLIGLRGVTAFKKEFIGLYLGFCIADSIFTCIFIGLVGFRGYAGGTSKLVVFFTEIFAANALIVLSKSLNLLSESELAMLRLGAAGT